MTTTEEFRALAARVEGPVLRPGDEGYDDECTGFNLAVHRRPLVVVGARTTADVSAAVEFAARHGLPAGVLAAGHGPAAAETDGGVLIATRRMTDVRIDPGAGTAVVAAGARFTDLLPPAAEYGLAPLNGSTPHLTVVPYVLGGGLSLLVRSHGLAVDRVRGMEVVTAEGRVRRVTPAVEPELFQALLGGRDNFGIVTELEMELVELASLYGGGLFFDARSSPRVLEEWLRWTRTVPERMNSSVALVPMPDDPELPEPLRGRDVFHVRIAYPGRATEAQRCVEPLRTAGEPLMEWGGEVPYAQNGVIHDDPPVPMAWSADHALLDDLDAGAVRRLLARVGPDAPLRSIVEVRHLGGAYARPGERPNTVGRRTARYLVGVLHPLSGVAVEGSARVLREALGELGAARTGRFLTLMGHGANAGPAEVASAYDPAEYQQLRELKAVYDPADTFRLNHHIPPVRG